MTKTAQKRTNIFGFLSVMVLSSATMVWMLWHFPIGTGIATVVVLSVYGVSARLARSIDSDALADQEHGNQGA
jgi:hypothetical protein